MSNNINIKLPPIKVSKPKLNEIVVKKPQKEN